MFCLSYLIFEFQSVEKNGKIESSAWYIPVIFKNTVKSYLTKLNSLGLSTDQLLAMDDVELGSKFHAGNPAYKDQRFEDLKDQLDYYNNELKNQV